MTQLLTRCFTGSSAEPAYARNPFLDHACTYRRRRRNVVGLARGIVCAMIAIQAAHGQTPQSDVTTMIAQIVKARWPKPGSERLTVHPHIMAIGTVNPAAGTYPLDPRDLASATPPDSSADVLVTVPPQCTGAHRCPLLLQLPGGGFTAKKVTAWEAPAANRYGYLLLTTTTYTTAFIDAALRETLRRFAVDPDKIAVLGRCASGMNGLRFGLDNLDVFSLSGSVSGGVVLFDGIDSRSTTTRFLIDVGLNELEDTTLGAIAAAKRDGRPVQLMTSIRTHEEQLEDEYDIGQWLHDNWTAKNPKNLPAPRRLPEPQPLLTTQVLAQLTTFWARFFQEPDSIRTTARMAYDRQTVVPLATTESWTYMVAMPAFAAQYPTVAEDLRAAGLTAEQHDVYRLAIISALVTMQTPRALAAINAQSVLAQNVAFIQTHPEEVKALVWSGVPKQEDLLAEDRMITGWPQWHANPEDVRVIGPMGIWRTP